MARYELTGPDGARYEVTAPDSATQDEVLARFRSEVGDGPEESMPVRLARLSTSWVPGSERIRAATGALGEHLFWGEHGPGLGERYDRWLTETRRRDDAAQRRETGVAGLLARTAGLAATTVGTGGYSLLRPVLSSSATLPQIAAESARIGAGMGAPIALANTRQTDPVAQAGDVVRGTIGGGVAGAILPFGFDIMSRIGRLPRLPFSGGGRAQRQAGTLQDFEDAGIPAPAAVIAESPTLQRTAQGLSRSVLGGPLQRDVAPAIEAVEQGVGRTVRGPNPVPQPSEFGGQQQEFLRRALTSHSRSSTELDAMDDAALTAAGSMRGGAKPETYPTQFGAQYRRAERTPVQGYGRAENIRGNFVDQFPPANVFTTQARNTVREALRRHRDQRRTAQYSPEEIEAIAQQWYFARETLRQPQPESLSKFIVRMGGLADHSGEVRHIAGGRNEVRGLINNRRGSAPDDAALRAWEAGYFPNLRERPTVSQFLERLQDDLGGLPVLRAADEVAVENRTIAAQMAEELHDLGVWNARNERQLRSRLGEQPPTPAPTPAVQSRAVTEPTATWKLLNEFGREARAAGALKGFKDNNFDEQFWANLRGRLGPDVTERLRSEHTRRLSGQASLTIPGLRDQRTLVRRTLDDLTSGGYPATAVGNRADLLRLHGSMTDDLQGFLRKANPEGGEWAAIRYTMTDRAYREFIEDIREPLRKIFGAKVAPDDAFRRLFAATQRDTQDIRLLKAYFRVLREKGDNFGYRQTTEATRALLVPAMEDGLPGFLKAWRNLSPEARQLMENNSTLQGAFERLDRYARLAQRLAPYSRGTTGIDFSQPSNLALAAGLLWHLPTALYTAGGAHLLARFMTSPRYMRWLTQAPLYTRGGINSPAFRGHINRLHALSGEDPEFGEAILQAMGEILRPASAERPPGMMRLGGPTDHGFLNETFLERFTAPARGIAGTITRLFEETPEAADRLLQYRTGQGELLPNQPLDAMSIAGLAGTGALPTAVGGAARGATLGTFIGRVGAENMARAGRPAAAHVLETAQQLERQGASVEQIQATAHRYIERNDPRLGRLEKGPDGQWRIELDDSALRYSEPQPGLGRLGDAVEHPELYLAYPNLPAAVLNRSPRYPGAAHHPGFPEVGLEPEIVLGNVSQPKHSIVHELQHEAQTAEGFARGGGPSDFGPGGSLSYHLSPNERPSDGYRRLAGEVEATRAANRQHMTTAERRETPIRMTAPNIPDTQQIVRLGRARARMAAPTLWTAERKAKLAQLHRQGRTHQQIALELGTTTKAIGRAIDRFSSELGLVLPHRQVWRTPQSREPLRELWDSGASYREIADVLGVSEGRVASVIPRYRSEFPAREADQIRRNTTRHVWTDEKLTEFAKLYRESRNLEEVARKMGISHRSARNALFNYRSRIGAGYRRRGGDTDAMNRRTVPFDERRLRHSRIDVD